MMTEQKIFFFWQGEKNEKLNNKIKLLKQNKSFDVILGPTKSEDDFLCQKYWYYKLAKQQKKYAFMADVWRVYITTLHSGIYVDAQTIIGPNFAKFCEKLFKEKVDTLVMENGTWLAAGFFYFNQNSPFFNWTLDYYLKFNNLNNAKFEDFPIIHLIFCYALFALNYSKKINFFKEAIRLKNKQINLLESEVFTMEKQYKIMARAGKGSWTTIQPKTQLEFYNTYIKRASWWKRWRFKMQMYQIKQEH